MAKPLPPGSQTITPYLMVDGADRALAFYASVFGATVASRVDMPQSGKIMHAALTIGRSQLFLGDACPEMGWPGPGEVAAGVSIFLYVDDVDATYALAVAEGAEGTMPPADMFWGDRFATIRDPFGHHWSLATHLEDLTPEQMQERMMSAFAAAS